MRTRIAAVALVLLAGACASDGPGFSASEPTTTLAPPAPSSSVATDSGSADTTTEAPISEAPTSSAPTVDACVSLADPGVGLQSGAIESGGNEYSYQWTVPSTAEPGQALPVVLDFHGIGSNGPQQGTLTGFGTLAETEGFVAVQPTGRSTSTDSRASWELPQFDTDERDDVAFVQDLLERLALDVCVDRTRIYSAGMSNGGFFTSVLVCELSDTIAAAASIAGVTHPDGCAPTRPVPYLAFHGTDDLVVPFAGGGRSALDGGVTAPFFEQVMPDEFAEFASDFGCAAPIDEEVAAGVSRRIYDECAGGAQLAFYTVDGGGHTWPGSEVSGAIPSLGLTTMEVDATELAWAFFRQYSRAG